MIFSRAILNKQALVNFFKDHKLHSPYRLVQFCQSLKKFTPAYLCQIALEIMWLPILIPQEKKKIIHHNIDVIWNINRHEI